MSHDRCTNFFFVTWYLKCLWMSEIFGVHIFFLLFRRQFEILNVTERHKNDHGCKWQKRQFYGRFSLDTSSYLFHFHFTLFEWRIMSIHKRKKSAWFEKWIEMLLFLLLLLLFINDITQKRSKPNINYHKFFSKIIFIIRTTMYWPRAHKWYFGV